MTNWQDHLQAYRRKHPDESLKQCMQQASLTYKGHGSQTSRRAPKDRVQTEGIAHLTKIINISKEMRHAELERNDVKSLQEIANKMQRLFDTYRIQSESDVSDSGKSGITESDSD